MKAADLRKAILQAAVQGKLVPQDKNDEPASELLMWIQAEKSALVKEGKLKKEKPVPPIDEDNIPYDLPNGWVWCRLGDLVSSCDGSIRRGPFGSAIRKDMFVPKDEHTYKVYEQGNAIRKTIEYGSYYISDEHYAKLKSFAVFPGDIIISCAGTLGETYILPDNAPKGIINQALLKLNINNAIMSDEFFLMVFKAITQQQIVQTSLGSAMKNLVSISWLKERVAFPLPPLAEQQHIVTKVDELMALCDELEAAEKELNALERHFFDYLPKSILQAAVQGKLVSQNKNDEPASELIKRIQAEKTKLIKEGKLKKEKFLPPIMEDEIPYDLPDEWVWCHIGDIVITNPRNSLADDTMVTFLPMSLISQDYFGGHKQDTKLWKEVKSGFTHFAEGDVLLAKITPCFQNGKSCIAHNLCSGYGAGTTELHVLRSILVDSRYLLLFLKCPIFIKAAEKNMTGTAGQQRVPTDYLRQFLFPLPPLAEQQRIVAKVDELMTFCDELKCVAEQPIDHSNVILFPAKTEPGDVEPIKMAAQGKVAALPSKQHTEALNDLLGMMDDD